MEVYLFEYPDAVDHGFFSFDAFVIGECDSLGLLASDERTVIDMKQAVRGTEIVQSTPRFDSLVDVQV